MSPRSRPVEDLLAHRIDRHRFPRAVPVFEGVEDEDILEIPQPGRVEDADEHHPRRGDPLGEVDIGARRVEVVVVRTHPADESVLR